MAEDVFPALRIRMRETCEVLSFKHATPMVLTIARKGEVTLEQTFFNHWTSEEDRHGV